MAIFLIGLREYPTKTAARSAVQSVLYRYGPGDTITDSDDQEFLADLVQLHPDAEGKIGLGIRNFEVRRNWSTLGFWIIRIDGTETDFSFVKCLHAPSQEQLVRTALRYAVIDQVVQFRDAALLTPIACPITGESLDARNAHVDHYNPTFLDLAHMFVADRGGYGQIGTSSADGRIGRRLVDTDLERAWQAFHRQNAHLRLVSVAANLGLLRRRTV